MNVLELFHYTFFQHALLGSLFASIACGIIGTYIVTRRLVFISGGITHASLRPYSLCCQLSEWNGSASAATCGKILPLRYSGHLVWQ